MAIVTYKVLYRYVHPKIKQPVTNTTDGTYNDINRFIKDYSIIDTGEIGDQESSDNPKFDMLFVYNGLLNITGLVPNAIINGHTVMVEKFEKCKGSPWFEASSHNSFESARNAAKVIIAQFGKQNCRIVKDVPLDVYVDVE